MSRSNPDLNSNRRSTTQSNRSQEPRTPCLTAGRFFEGRRTRGGALFWQTANDTGRLTPADYEAAAHWDCITTGSAIALIRILDVAMPADSLRARIEGNLSRQKQPELSAVHLVRARADISSEMPRFMAAFIERQFAD
jgi:hypothetical protein